MNLISKLLSISLCNIYLLLSAGWMGKVFSKLRMETAKRTDKRIEIMNEIISGMKVIKMYTWEKSFAKLIALYRRYTIIVYTNNIKTDLSLIVLYLFLGKRLTSLDERLISER